MGDFHTAYHCVLLGAGPRGTSFLERLLAQLEHGDFPQQRIHCTVIDPYPPGAGHVWRQDQNPLFVMNTPALFPTVAPVGASCTQLPASSVGMSFLQWLDQCQPYSTQPAAHLAEGIGAADFPARALYGAYLADQFQAVAQALSQRPEVASFQVHQGLATGIRAIEGGRYQVLADEKVYTADALILAVGHLPARLNPNQSALAEQAAEHQLNYIEPNISGDVDWSQLPAGEPVLVRGMGLNFFDVMIALTQGRGGVFEPAGAQRLRYRPSGQEPQLVVASRRGVPYRGKAVLESYFPASVQLRYFTQASIDALVERFGTLDFRAHLWPLLNRDVLINYYRTLGRTQPELFTAPATEFVARLTELLDSAHHGEEVSQAQAEELLAEYAPGLDWFSVRDLAHPAAGLSFADRAAYNEWVQHYLADDIDQCFAAEDSALKMAVGTLQSCRELLKEQIRLGRVSDESRIRDIAGWFGPLIEGLASGPPVERIQQLLALADAGVVSFEGPDPLFEVEVQRDTFQLSSPRVHGAPVQARALVEAMMPANQIQLNASVFVNQLFEQGLAEVPMMTNEEGLPLPGQGVKVTDRPYRLSAHGVEHNIFVLGLQLSSVQWGTAIAGEAGASAELGARTLADADAAAAAVLEQARQREE